MNLSNTEGEKKPKIFITLAPSHPSKQNDLDATERY